MDFPCSDCRDSNSGKECRDFLSCEEWGRYYDETKQVAILEVRERNRLRSQTERSPKEDCNQARL